MGTSRPAASDYLKWQYLALGRWYARSRPTDRQKLILYLTRPISYLRRQKANSGYSRALSYCNLQPALLLRPDCCATIRRVRSQESRNEQLKAQLAELQRLKAEEEQLGFDIFKARLNAADQERLQQENKGHIGRRSPVSTELQLEIAQDEILRGWFTAAGQRATE